MTFAQIRRTAVAVSLLLLGVGFQVGCDGGGEPAQKGAGTAIQSTTLPLVKDAWPVQVAKDFPAFQSLLESAPSKGWQKLYQHQYQAAADAFEAGDGSANALGAARSHLALAALYGEGVSLALDVDASMSMLLAENKARVSVVPTDLYMQAVYKIHRGDGAGAIEILSSIQGDGELKALIAAAWSVALIQTGKRSAGLEKSVRGATTPDSKALVHALTAIYGDGGQEKIPSIEGLSVYGKRAHLLSLVEVGQLDEALAFSKGLVGKAADLSVSVAGAEGPIERKYYDPLGLLALSRLHSRLALRALEGEVGVASIFRMKAMTMLGEDLPMDALTAPTAAAFTPWLPALVFGPYGTPQDLLDSIGQSKTPCLAHKMSEQLGDVPKAADQGQAVRATQKFAQALEAEFVDVLAELGPESEGVATVKALHLPRGIVASLVRHRANEFDKAGRSLSGLALLEYTFEKEKSSQVTHINSPGLFLKTTQAYGQLQRHREALNYLFRLLEPFPELWLLYEAMSNLSVLGTLDQPGVNAQ